MRTTLDRRTDLQASSELGTRDIQGFDASRDLILWSIFIRVREVCHHLEFHDFDSEFGLVLLDCVLSVVWSVEILASTILARPSMISADDEVSRTVVLSDDGVPDGFTRTTHTHGQTEQTKNSHSIGVSGHESLVDAYPSEVVNVTRLGQTHHTSPAQLLKVCPQLCRCISQSNIVVVVQPVDSLDLAAHVVLFGGVHQELDGWVFWISSEHFLSLLLLVWLVDVIDGEDGKVSVVSEVSEGNSGARLHLQTLNSLV